MSEYAQRFVLHARLSKGGYMYGYEILYGGAVIGSKSIVKDTRQTPARVKFVLGSGAGAQLEDENVYATAAEFKAAHQRSLAATPAEEVEA